MTILAGQGYEVETLEGVGPKTGKALRAAGIATLADFLLKGYKPQQRAEIATQISVRPKMIDSWASMSDLLRIEGVDHQTAELMVKSGVLTVTDLTTQQAESLQQVMEKTNKAGKRSIAPSVPSSEHIQQWIQAASKLKPVVIT